VFDFDRDGDVMYMTMELLQGRSLDELVHEARGVGIEPRKALSIVRGIAEGLAYAHRKGIVHSDLKPGNIFILDDGTPKILDFGIARAVPSQGANAAPDAFDAVVLGGYTEAYATNEMMDGAAPHPADDMYSLGVIGYELITGFHPFERHSAPQARELGIEPPPLTGLKRREARALERCLAFDRAQRPQSAGEFLQAFRGIAPAQKAMIAATIVLALVATWFSYEHYRETGPAVPFHELPPDVQQKFRDHMADGDMEMSFYQQGTAFAVNNALEHYANAYALHERNREAAKALERLADVWLAAARTPEERRTIATTLLGHSSYYHRYAPVVEAAQDPR
jgi:serine/threonine protein kinase